MSNRKPSIETAQHMRDFYRTSVGYKQGLASQSLDFHQFYADFVRQFAPEHGTVLDLGCGTGTSTRLLQQYGLEVVGADVSDLFLAHNRNLGQANVTGFATGDMLKLPFQDESFDTVASCNVMEHIPDPEAALIEQIRITKPGGIIVVLSPNLCSPLWPIKDLPGMLSPGWTGRTPWYRTRFEALQWGVSAFRLTRQKIEAEDLNFIYRQPSLRGGADCGDGDSVYQISPVDVTKLLTQHGLDILSISTGETIQGKLVGQLWPYYNNTITIAARKIKV